MSLKLIGGILLVAGTAVGAGMLALPVLTCMAGFVPSLFLLILVWLGTLFTALLVMEVTLWFKKEVNLITMARQTLGKTVAAITWGLFLLLLYSLTAAYLSGGAGITHLVVEQLFAFSLPLWAEPLPYLLLFGAFVYLGTRSVDYLNRLLMFGLFIVYIALVCAVIPEVKFDLLAHAAPNHLWAAIPVMVTSFGFHIIIPSLVSYLERDVKQIKSAIVIGSSIPLVIYIIWELVVLGAIPLEGDHGLYSALMKGLSAAHPLSNLLGHPWVTAFAQLFAFFAMTTSFLGVSLSLSSFLRDGFKIEQSLWGKWFVCVATFLPPLLFYWLVPHGFIAALEYAGIIVVLISGILPACMVWKGRLMYHEGRSYRVRGGTWALLATVFIALAIIAVELGEKCTS